MKNKILHFSIRIPTRCIPTARDKENKNNAFATTTTFVHNADNGFAYDTTLCRQIDFHKNLNC